MTTYLLPLDIQTGPGLDQQVYDVVVAINCGQHERRGAILHYEWTCRGSKELGSIAVWEEGRGGTRLSVSVTEEGVVSRCAGPSRPPPMTNYPVSDIHPDHSPAQHPQPTTAAPHLSTHSHSLDHRHLC